MKPYIIKSYTDSSGKIIENFEPETVRNVISEKVSSQMREILEQVVANGTGKGAYVNGFRIGGKTGTSQKVSKIQATGDTYLYIGSCITLAPIDDPEIAVFVMLDEPKGDNYYGGVISAPVNAKIMADVLPYLGYEPSYSEEELKKMSIEVPSVVGETVDEAKGKITAKKLEYKVIGSGEKVVRQLPEGGSKVVNGGTVIIYTEKDAEKKVTVPDFSGLTATEANKAAAAAGVNIEFSGNITTGGLKAYSQSIKKGKEVDAGTVVTVYFRDESTVDG